MYRVIRNETKNHNGLFDMPIVFCKDWFLAKELAEKFERETGVYHYVEFIDIKHCSDWANRPLRAWGVEIVVVPEDY